MDIDNITSVKSFIMNKKLWTHPLNAVFNAKKYFEIFP